ncbi:hypothetical protein V5O48_006604, partial [Marasmius crinis-equi]
MSRPSSHREPCIFVRRPGGCRRGTSCRFSHDLNVPLGPNRVGNAAATARPPPPDNRNRFTENAPRGNCNFFWSTGQCNRGFECTFKHVQKPSTDTNRSPGTPEFDEPSLAEHLDFCTSEGLAEMNDIAYDRNYLMSPSQAHNSIKIYINPNFAFSDGSRATQMTEFAKILASVDRRNPSWDSETAQVWDGVSNTLVSMWLFPDPADLILKSTLHHNINALYTALNDTFETVCDVVTTCMNNMIDARSWKDPTPGLPSPYQSSLSGVVVFSTLSTVLHQYFLRFRRTAANQPKFVAIVDKLTEWFETWSTVVAQGSGGFDDNLEPTLRRLTLDQLRGSIERLQKIVSRVQANQQATKKLTRPKTLSADDRMQALLTRLEQSYDPPGVLRAGGLPRHDNDTADISEIRIVPTQQELLSEAEPYLPPIVPGAPHHCPEGSMERHLDIQFRLLREELIAPIRDSIGILQMDFSTMSTARRRAGPKSPTKIEQLIQNHGGVYRTSGHNSLMFQVYAHVEFSPVKAHRRELTVGLIMDAPPGNARSPDRKVREEFWHRTKRLGSGGLICLLLARDANLSIYPGIVLSSNTDIAESAKVYEDQVEIRVRFFDPEVELMALRRDKLGNPDQFSHAVLIDNNI